MSDLSPAAQQAIAQLTKRIESSDVEVPLLPEVARKVISIVNDPDSDAIQLAQVIQGDQAMAANILRIANSPAYSPNGNIVSLQQAISRLGMQVMFEVAIAASVNSKMFNAPGFESHIDQILNDSLTTGLWAKEIARSSHKNVEAAFLCGLLHNIGRPMLLQWVVEVVEDISQDDAFAVENALFAKANRAVIEHWQLPSLILDGIEASELSAGQGGQSSISDVGKLLRAAIDMTAWMKLNGSEADAFFETVTSLSNLNLYADEVSTIQELKPAIEASREAMRV